MLWMEAPEIELKEGGCAAMEGGFGAEHMRKAFSLDELIAELASLTTLMKEAWADKVEEVMVTMRALNSQCVVTISEYGYISIAPAKRRRTVEARALRDSLATSFVVSKTLGQPEAFDHDGTEEESGIRQVQEDRQMLDIGLVQHFDAGLQLPPERPRAVRVPNRSCDQCRLERRQVFRAEAGGVRGQ